MEPSRRTPPRKISDWAVFWVVWLNVSGLFLLLMLSARVGTILIPFVIPVWLPLVFVAYAVIRRQFSLQALLVFTSLEAAALALSKWIVQGFE